jgi:CPA1 family monovalent cation:H+ antiporter
MSPPDIVLLVAALVALISLVEPLAGKLRLPASVLLAAIGLVVAAAAAVLAADETLGPVGEWAKTIASIPVGSAVFLTVFLPALLFNAALEADAREMAGDAVPILTLAVVAVVVATLTIGLVLYPLAGVPLLACLLLGAIVATTDPIAVIAVFRDLGAPQRLTRILEGESLLNDAAAITLFVIFLGALRTGSDVSVASAAAEFILVAVGGAVLGAVAGRVCAALLRIVGDNRLVTVSLTLALPYLAFLGAEQFHLSAPVAVVVAGLTLVATGRSRVAPSDWRYLEQIWEQLAFWAGSLVFVLSALIVPRLMAGFGWDEMGLVAVLVVAAFVARAAVLWGLMPTLSFLKLSPPIASTFRAVILWGGLRGAVTLALAMAVTETPGVPDEIKRFVAVLATAFTLFTLLVQGTTLRPLIALLGLNRLSAADQALREEALAMAHAGLRPAIEKAAADYGVAPELAAEIVAEHLERHGGASVSTGRELPDGSAAASIDRTTLAMVALAIREHDLILRQLESRTVSPDLAGPLLAFTRRLLDAARPEGAPGYCREAEAALAFSWRIRLANALHTRFAISRFLEAQLASRFETLLINRISINELTGFAAGHLTALLGPTVGATACAALASRTEATARALDALRLQYPEYAADLERRFLRMAALRRERDEYERLYEDGLVGPEVRRSLLSEVAEQIRREARPRLDLKLDTATLIARVPLFGACNTAAAAELARLMRPAFAIPGQRLVSKGERGDSAWFIASGAVEVDTGETRVRLGRGDFFGELALLTGAPRNADVMAIGFSELLVLHARDFRTFLDLHPAIRAQVEAVAAERLGRGSGFGARAGLA